MPEALHCFVLFASLSTRAHMVEVLSLAANGLRPEVAVLRVPDLVLAAFPSGADMFASVAPKDACVFGFLGNNDDLPIGILKCTILRNCVCSWLKFCRSHDLITLLKRFKKNRQNVPLEFVRSKYLRPEDETSIGNSPNTSLLPRSSWFR